MKIGQPGMEEVEINDDERKRRQRECNAAHHGRHGEEPANVRIDEVEESLGVDTLKPHRQHVRDGLHQLLLLFFAAAFDELFALTSGVGDHQTAAVEHADELLEFFSADSLRWEI